MPIQGKTGLRILAGAIPPFVIDVDDGSTRTVRSFSGAKLVALWVLGISPNWEVLGAVTAHETKLYAIQSMSDKPKFIANGDRAWASNDGHALWVENETGPTRCTLREVGLKGQVLRASRPFACVDVPAPAVAAPGLVVNQARIVDPSTGRTVYTAPSGATIVAVARRRIVLANGPGKPLTLIDLGSSEQKTFPWPSSIGVLDDPAVDPRGRFVALAFANASLTNRWGQASDVWVIDTKTGLLTHVPDMPASVALKHTSMQWTQDGRLIFLAQSGGRDIVAVWRPGEAQLGVKTMHLPNRNNSGSDSFALLH